MAGVASRVRAGLAGEGAVSPCSATRRVAWSKSDSPDSGPTPVRLQSLLRLVRNTLISVNGGPRPGLKADVDATASS
jgi:hypothetical protein